MRFQVKLDTFRGPLDLLLFLVRKREVEIVNLPIVPVADQFLERLSSLEQVDVDAVGDFLEVASSLIEIKSRMVLPSVEEIDEDIDDPRQELVRKLLEYKELSDAASMLEERSRVWRDRYSRVMCEEAIPRPDFAQQPLQEVELWDIVSAFGRVLRSQAEQSNANSICYDDTPIHVFMERIHRRLQANRRIDLFDLFDGPILKSTLVGMFLAVLELMRHRCARAAQSELFGDVALELGEEPLPAGLGLVSDYEHAGSSASHSDSA